MHLPRDRHSTGFKLPGQTAVLCSSCGSVSEKMIKGNNLMSRLIFTHWIYREPVQPFDRNTCGMSQRIIWTQDAFRAVARIISEVLTSWDQVSWTQLALLCNNYSPVCQIWSWAEAFILYRPNCGYQIWQAQCDNKISGGTQTLCPAVHQQVEV